MVSKDTGGVTDILHISSQPQPNNDDIIVQAKTEGLAKDITKAEFNYFLQL